VTSDVFLNSQNKMIAFLLALYHTLEALEEVLDYTDRRRYQHANTAVTSDSQ
jgi:hypothetical protein